MESVEVVHESADPNPCGARGHAGNAAGSTVRICAVALVQPGPNKNNPNLFPIGDGFGLFVFFGKFNAGVRGR